MEQQWGQFILAHTQVWFSTNRHCCNRRIKRNVSRNVFSFGRYRDDADKINLLLKYVNSLNENLKFTAEIGGKSL